VSAGGLVAVLALAESAGLRDLAGAFMGSFTIADPAIRDTVAADKIHRHHAVIEQAHTDLKGAALAHLPSGVFTANAAWLVLAVIAFNLTRGAAPALARATTATIRRKLISVPASRFRSPADHPAPAPGLALGDRLDRSVRPGSATRRPSSRPDHPAANAARPEDHRG
jgi:hypothetical protein